MAKASFIDSITLVFDSIKEAFILHKLLKGYVMYISINKSIMNPLYVFTATNRVYFKSIRWTVTKIEFKSAFLLYSTGNKELTSNGKKEERCLHLSVVC